MKHRSVLSCLFLVAVTAIGVFGLAQDSPTEAPEGGRLKAARFSRPAGRY